MFTNMTLFASIFLSILHLKCEKCFILQYYMISKTIRCLLALFVCSSNPHNVNGFHFHSPPSQVPIITHQAATFLPFDNLLHMSQFSDGHWKEEIGKDVVLSVSAALPKFDTIGHKILSANHDFIYDILHNEILSSPMKKEIILLSIRLAQMGDDMGSQILQYYYNLVDASL